MFAHKAELYKAIDEILWNNWNPIGINDVVTRDKYQTYTLIVFSLKINGADIETIGKKLYKIETEIIGLLGIIDQCRNIVDKINNLD